MYINFSSISYYLSRSLAINPNSGMIYWTHWNSAEKKAALFSAWMDGTHKQILAESTKEMPMKWPFSLHIDHVNDELYW